jgi:hypothetical protein
MKQNIESLLKQITHIYTLEKLLGFSLAELQSANHHIRIRHGLAVETEENQRHCERLEALIAILKPLSTSVASEEDLDACIGNTSDLLKRFTAKHLNTGYDTSILVAEVMGRTDILNTLHACMDKDPIRYADVA